MKQLLLILISIFPFSSFCSIQDLAFKSDKLTVDPISVPYNEIDNYPAKQQWKQEFLNRYGNQWGIIIDLRSGAPLHIFGKGIPFFPGIGNDLPFKGEITESEVVNSVMEFLSLHSALFNIDTQEVYLSSATNIEENWYINFSRKYKNIDVTGSRLLFTISHGNLVRISAVNWGNINISIEPTYTEQQAIGLMETYFDVQNILGTTKITPLSLSIIPTRINGENKANYTGNLGEGYGYILAYRVSIDNSEEGVWTGLVNAQDGSILAIYSRALAASASGKVKGNIHYYSGIESAPTFSSYPFALPYADLREISGDCFGLDDTVEQCRTKLNCPLEEINNPFSDYDIYCDDPENDPELDDTGMLYCSHESGNFFYESSFENVRTRLYGPYQ
ncbi:MAG TPA: hypothetical protein PK014_10685 [Thermoanaerobaculia bacterium]|mgnify:CR=1 FL=1|nr:hypothetical protein [Thermoanaerobaculia bacterium]HUM30587.1 hypothetical protein [Thermoanaerobaculia bacterium]HXK68779.1 hypothetical protein [Thermoanaerobaculia bacterium]